MNSRLRENDGPGRFLGVTSINRHTRIDESLGQAQDLFRTRYGIANLRYRRSLLCRREVEGSAPRGIGEEF